MLNTNDLTCARTAIGLTLPGTVIISRSTQASDGMGGVVDTFGPVGTVAARVSPAARGVGEDEQIAGGEFVAALPWVVTMPAGTVITERDQLLYGSRVFEIGRVDAGRSYEVAVRAYCREVR